MGREVTRGWTAGGLYGLQSRVEGKREGCAAKREGQTESVAETNDKTPAQISQPGTHTETDRDTHTHTKRHPHTHTHIHTLTHINIVFVYVFLWFFLWLE